MNDEAFLKMVPTIGFTTATDLARVTGKDRKTINKNVFRLARDGKLCFRRIGKQVAIWRVDGD
jgi:predicted transcriptional regulator